LQTAALGAPASPPRRSARDFGDSLRNSSTIAVRKDENIFETQKGPSPSSSGNKVSIPKKRGEN
jgi:hypothetical protein